MTARAYCFTSYELDKIPSLTEEVRYVIWQKEKCPKTGSIHFQGYIEFKQACRMAAVKKWYGSNKLHVEKRNGEREEARDYCRKEESRVEGPWELGSWEAGGQGTRNDVKKVANMVWDHKTNYQIAKEEDVVYMRMHRGVDALRKAMMEEESLQERDIEVHILWGKPGVGKTSSVLNSHDKHDVYKLMYEEGGIWWDGYYFQKILLLDDFTGWIPYEQMLSLLDRYQCRLRTKGSFVYANWTKVYITSNIEPNLWYAKGLRALERRITSIKNVTGCHEVGGNTSPPTSNNKEVPEKTNPIV